MNPSPNQPILFQPSEGVTLEECRSERWQYRMFENDEIYWQFQIEPCLDADQVVSDPFFIPNAAWTANAPATVVPAFAFAIIPIGGSIQQDLTTVADAWYQVNINVSEFVGSVGQGRVVVSGFGTSYEFPGQVDRFTFYLQATGTTTTINIAFTAQSGSGSVQINEVTAYEVEYPEYEFLDVNGNPIADTANQFDEADYSTWSLVPSTDLLAAKRFQIRVYRTCDGEEISWTSEWICIIAENERDLLISGCGNINSFGSNFQPVVRVRGELMKGTAYSFPNRYTYQDSKAAFFNGYTHRNKAYTLKVDLVPEHIRDFIYMIALYNSIAIKVGTGSQFNLFLEEEPDDPVFPEGEKDLATITMRMVRKEANEVSTFDIDCTRQLPPTVIGENAIDRAIQADTDELIQA